jgi:probable rRNA maturation factor
VSGKPRRPSFPPPITALEGRPRRESSLNLIIQRASRAAHIPADKLLRKWARAAVPRAATVTVRYVAEAEGRRINREFRGKDYATNVLSFAYQERPLAGDIVICAPVVASEAREQGKSVQAHHAHLLVHGLLHLQGFDHDKESGAKRMESRERAVLAKLGFPDPYRVLASHPHSHA